MIKKISAILLAAGYSSRMKTMKALLPFGTSTVLARAISPFTQAGVEDIRVVTGYNRELISPLLIHMGVKEIHNSRYAEGMFSSVQAGVSSLGEEVDGFFIMPVDYPLLNATVVAALLKKFENSKAEILHPCHDGKRGHPPLLSGTMQNRILQWEGSDGLKGLLRQYEDKSLNVPVTDIGILLDMDTPEQYQYLLEMAEKEGAD